jgi:multidrug efflux pump subunit AcrA (membrane-fusion protein)
LEKYLKGEWEQHKKDAEIAIEEAEITLQREKEDFEAAKELIELEYITRTDFEHDEFNFIKAKWDLAKARMAQQVLQTYTHVAELRKRQSDVEEAAKECDRVRKNAAAEETKKTRAVEGKEKELALTQDQLAKLRTQKENCRITAPTPGFVVYYSEHWRWGSNDQIKEGAEVRERQVLMQLPDISKMTAVVRVHEAKTSKLGIGQRAVVEVEGMPDKRFTGSVTKIAAIADTQNRWLNPDLKEYETEITLDPFDVTLKPGVTTHVELLVETVEDSLAVPIQSVYSKAGRRYVFRQNGRDLEYIEVQVGSISTEWAQISGGLADGDQILLAFSDAETRMIPDLPPLRRRGMPAGGRTVVGQGTGADPQQAKASPEGRRRPGGQGTASPRRSHASRGARANSAKKP